MHHRHGSCWLRLVFSFCFFMTPSRAGHGQVPEPIDRPLWEFQTSGTGASLRGLAVPNSRIAWTSGERGTVLRSTDGGRTWYDVSITTAATLDLRDIEAWDERSAVVLAVGSPAKIFRTRDAGQSWQEAYADDRPGIFLDAMSFWDERHGIAFGDPIDDRLVILTTSDQGASWRETDPEAQPRMRASEAGFAASGTSLCTHRPDRAWIGLGGAPPGVERRARILFSEDRGHQWSAVETSMPAGPSQGVFSIAFLDDRRGVAVGGDYQTPERVPGNMAITDDGGRSWRPITGNPPNGYRSAVAVCRHGDHSILVTVGTTGSDYSHDGGETWESLGSHGFHAVQFSPDGTTGWAVGAGGRIARWQGPLANAP